MKRLDLIERKLKAIRDKDVSDIVAKRVYIPFMGKAGVDKLKGKTIGATHISNWLEVRARVLEDAREISEAEIETRIKELAETLCDNCKKLVSLAEPRNISESCAKDYDALCKIWLYQFSLGKT